ncbi:hypothetical protein DC522_17110 [Microvirga sp. KLBC 81]|nr:hypothetical protein DC522_17110 [Microvirga sp. KLBC 81]
MAGPVPAIHVLRNTALILRAHGVGVSKEVQEGSGSSFETDCSSNPPQDEDRDRKGGDARHKAGHDGAGSNK